MSNPRLIKAILACLLLALLKRMRRPKGLSGR